MNRLFITIAAGALAFSANAAAQNTMPQPGPQGTTQNQNAPQMQMTPAQPSQAPNAGTSTVAPTTPAPTSTATTPATGKSETGASGSSTTPATGTAAATSNAATSNDSSKGGANSDAAKSSTDAKPESDDASEKADTTEPSRKIPHTEMVGTPSSGPQSADPLLQPPPMPPNKSTLIGGIAKKVDRIRNKVVIAPYGSSKTITVNFDERSHIYRDSRETTVLGIQKGDRIYVDSMLIGPRVFARNLRVVTTTTPAEASGQIVAYDPRSQTVRLVDKLTNAPVVFRVTKDTELRSKSGQATAADIQPGSLVSVIFAPGRKGGDAKQLSILAVPGTNYIFAGRITNLDVHAGIIDVENQSDGKNYELHFPPSMENRGELRVGAQVAANASFNGRTYTTQTVTIMPEQSENAQQ